MNVNVYRPIWILLSLPGLSAEEYWVRRLSDLFLLVLSPSKGDICIVDDDSADATLTEHEYAHVRYFPAVA